MGKEIAQNVVSGTESLKYNYLGKKGDIPSVARAGVKWFGKLGALSGTIFLGTDLYQDYHKYSGVDLAIAWGTDLIPIGTGIIGAGAGAAVGGYIGGLVGGGTGAVNRWGCRNHSWT